MSDTNLFSFTRKLTGAIARNDSLLCVGLDPDPANYPAYFSDAGSAASLLEWGLKLIEQTADLVCCYKPNAAFYMQYGPAGLEALQRTIAAVPHDIPVLLDVKWGDIGSTAQAYARAAFEQLQVDAVTLSPYLGRDSVAPFLSYPGKTVFVLCFTSNPSAAEIQEFGSLDRRLFEHVLRQAAQWGDETQIAFVVGATQPQALAHVRRLLGGRKHWILAPGVGAQGGDLQVALEAGLDADRSGLIVPVSRGVTYAADPRQAARTLRAAITQARQVMSPAGSDIKPDQDLIIQLHEVGCIQFGEFTLASGRQSPIYIDLRRMSASPALLQLAARAYAGLLRSLTFDRLAAVPYAALTIGTAVALATGRPLIYPRKETKTYGTGKSIEGLFSAGETVVVIEDLVTSGGSVLQAIEQLEAAQLKVADVAVLIDREQGGPENLAAAGYRLHAAFKLSEVLAVLLQTGRISAEAFEQVSRYLAGND